MLVDFTTDTSPPPGNVPCARVATGSAMVDPTLWAGIHTVQLRATTRRPLGHMSHTRSLDLDFECVSTFSDPQ